MNEVCTGTQRGGLEEDGASAPPSDCTAGGGRRDFGSHAVSLVSPARAQGRLLPDGATGPVGWQAREKFAAVVETAGLNEA